MRFVDFLKATVFTCAGAATALAAITIAASSSNSDSKAVVVLVCWWLLAGGYGAYLGRRGETTPAIGGLLAAARSAHALPEQRPGWTLLNRLWPLLVFTVVAGTAGVWAPQVPGIATGFAIIWALAWRRQESAVTAIEERDGARFYLERTSPFRPIELVRTPGFRARFQPDHPTYEKAETSP